MTLEQWIVLFVVAGLIGTLAFTRARPFHVFLVAVLLLGITGVLTPEEMLRGFSNPAVVLLVMVLAFSHIFRSSSLIHWLYSQIIVRAKNFPQFYTRFVWGVAPFSGIMSNTLLTAVSLPHILEWARRQGIFPSRVLLPTAYAIIAGGTLTLIGTSSHLVIYGFYQETTGKALDWFVLFPYGVGILLMVYLYFLLLNRYVTPVRRDPQDQVVGAYREYTAEARVPSGSSIAGLTVARARLRHLRGLFLAQIIRGDQKISPVKPTDVIQEGDILVFVGRPETILELAQTHRLEIGGFFARQPFTTMDVVEVVIPQNSMLVNRKIRDIQFRGRYDAVVIAVHRQGERLESKLGDVVLKPGDLLLLLTGPDFAHRVEQETNLYVVGKVGELHRYVGWKDATIVGVLLFALLVSLMNWVPLIISLATALVLLSIFQVLSLRDLRTGVDWTLVLITALAIPVGYSLVKSGLLEKALSLLPGILAESDSPLLWLYFLFGVSVLLTELTFNVGAAAIAGPLSVEVARTLHQPEEPFLVTVMLGTALSFLTPYGYQVNLMIMGPGGYRYLDYLRAGGPLLLMLSIWIPAAIYVVYWKNPIP